MPDYYSFDVGEYEHHGYVWPTKVPLELRLKKDPPLELICASHSAPHGKRGVPATTLG
jgi:hypothetical protein